MLYSCSDAIETKLREAAGGTAFGSGVAEGVAAEINELLSSKSKSELEDMLIEIKGSMQKGGEGMDTQFFDAVAAKIPLYVAHAEISDWHNKGKAKADAWMKTQEEEERAGRAASPPRARSATPDREPEEEGDWDGDVPSGRKDEADADRGDFSPELEPLSVLEERKDTRGNCSPVLEPLKKFDEQDLLDPEEDDRIMRQVRETLLNAFRDPSASSSSNKDAGLDRSRDDELYRQEAARGVGQGEASFNAPGKGTGDEFHGELELQPKSYEWENKYRPRKPRFFNRVKTGYEWNKYNQTHYDHDNPPPKRVQGYKFNVFYPDLIDKTKAPNYYLEKDDTAETVTLRFHAGPPYEDVAFKIVNCEWNLSHKFGFRVVFDRGVLQLYFNFKRWRYRR